MKTALTRIRVVFLEGTALRVVDEEWSEPGDVVSGDGALLNGGRFNAAGSFRVVYLTEDSRNGLREINYPFSAGGKSEIAGPRCITVVPVEFRLERVLGLCDFHRGVGAYPRDLRLGLSRACGPVAVHRCPGA